MCNLFEFLCHVGSHSPGARGFFFVYRESTCCSSNDVCIVDHGGGDANIEMTKITKCGDEIDMTKITQLLMMIKTRLTFTVLIMVVTMTTFICQRLRQCIDDETTVVTIMVVLMMMVVTMTAFI